MRFNQHEKYLDPKGIGDILGLAAKTIRDKIVREVGFPLPVYLPMGEKGCARKRWRRSEVVAWMERINSAHPPHIVDYQ